MSIPKEALHWLERMPDWFLEQLHLSTDNVHIQNLWEPPISLSLYEFDGNAWSEQALGELGKLEHKWITLEPLSPVFIEQSRPAGETVLVVRAAEATDGELVRWRIENLHYHLWLYSHMYTPSNCFSRSTGCKLLDAGAVKPQSPNWGFTHKATPELLDAHWEYWFSQEILKKPMP